MTVNVRHRFFFTSDLLLILLCGFFSICSFLNLGTLRIEASGLILDREALLGCFFILLILLVLCFCKWANGSRSGLVRFLRLFYVQAFYFLFFQECIVLSQLFFNGGSLDYVFAGLDEIIFSVQPAVHFHQLLPDNPWITELFFFGYFFYYLLAIGSYWILFAADREKQAAQSLVVTSVAFFLLYVFYTFFPVKGPKGYLPELTRLWYTNFQGYFFTGFMQNLFFNMNLAGAAFPSSHTTIALIAVLFNWRYNRRLAIFFLPFTLLLFASTVYIYAHYVIDVLAGILLGPVLFAVIPAGLRKLEPLLTRIDAHLGKSLKMTELGAYHSELTEDTGIRES